MEYVYLLIFANDWEEMIIFLTEEEAIKASISYPNTRVEIFGKNIELGYIPTYNYYKAGQYYNKI